LQSPAGITGDRHGVLTIVDAGHHRLVQLMADTGEVIARFGQNGAAPGHFSFVAPSDPDLGLAGDGGGGLAVGRDGTLFVADRYNRRIQRLDSERRPVSVWRDVPSATHPLAEPAGLAVDDRRGRVYVADAAAHRIQVFDVDGRWQHGWGGVGTGPGQVNSPLGVAIDRQGHVLVADCGNNRIQVFDDAGRFVAEWGMPAARPAEMGWPLGVAVDAAGHVYVATPVRIVVFSETGVSLASWGEEVVGGRFTPSGVAIDSHGSIFVTDWGRHCVLKFRPRQPWPTPVTAQPTPRPTSTIATSVPAVPPPQPPMTPSDR
jgi:DNA-binding beta-propeller fold protein YncE